MPAYVADTQAFRTPAPASSLAKTEETTPASGSVLLVVLTAVYLLVELSFNARLLDVAGAALGGGDVEDLEQWGKSLSGFAAAILLAKFLYKRCNMTAMLALVVSSPLIFVVYFAQGKLIDILVARASTAERQIATYVSLMPGSLVNQTVNLHGLDMSTEEMSSPEGKTFMALFPALAYTSPEVVKAIDAKLVPILQGAVEREVGSSDDFFNNVYRVAVNDVKKFYNEDYVPASNRGVSRWRFNRGASKALGFKSTIGPGLGWSKFAAHPDIQKKVRTQLSSKLSAGVLPKHINLNWSPDEVERYFYRPYVASIVKNHATKLRSEQDSFAKDGVNGEQAEAAVRTVLVPPLALFFSLFFGVLNLAGLLAGGISTLLSKASDTAKFVVTWGLRLAIVACVILVPLQFSNSVSQSEAFNVLLSKIENRGSSLMGIYLTWVVKAEPAFYPIATAIRQNALLGFRFTFPLTFDGPRLQTLEAR